MIQLSDVRKVYKTGNINVEALRGVNLQIENGEMIVVAGPSGSGKSTLLNLIGGMDRVSDGKIIFDGEDISNYNSSQLTNFRSRKVGFIFQSFHLIPVLNIYENIVVPLKLKGQPVDKKKVLDLIDRVGLSHHIKHKPDELSGGQKQRVAIARALIHNPPYIMADEPTANLDSKTSASIVDLLKDLNKNLKVTIIFATHDQWVLKAIDKEITISDGIIVS